MTVALYLLTLVLPLATILIVFGMRYISAVMQARARMTNDDAYRQFAENASTTQSQIATSLTAIDTRLTDIRSRMAAVETILNTVA